MEGGRQLEEFGKIKEDDKLYLNFKIVSNKTTYLKK